MKDNDDDLDLSSEDNDTGYFENQLIIIEEIEDLVEKLEGGSSLSKPDQLTLARAVLSLLNRV